MVFKANPRMFLARQLSPARIFIISFLAVILLGAFLLWLPLSAGKGGHLSFVDALFTSTSAVCVTGLIVVDTGKDLSFAGQIVTMLLFQIGGLGIITFSTVLFGMMGRSISFKGREIVQSTFLHTPQRDLVIIAKWVLLSTLCIEGTGTLLLFSRFQQDFPAGQAFYQALYHAISAFNNAGFSLFTDNLIGYQSDALVSLTVSGLIVLGGIGFIVQYEVVNRLRGKAKNLSIHTRIVLLTTAILIIAGAVLFYLFEINHMLKGKSALTQALICIFQSITPRTAGFNTVDIGLLTNATILVMMILMFIGASPGSTGGGIKTTSFALLMLMIWNRFRGSEDVSVFNRTLPKEILGRTIGIIFASGFAVCLITSVLLVAGGVENLNPAQSRNFFVEYLFETISAFSTVGLSMGITPKMTDMQKLAITLMMFAGRVGPLTLAFSWHSSRRKITYAEESVMVG